MPREITIDVRGLDAPEPMERVLEAIDDFGPGDRLTVLIDCEPRPLFRILERNGYAHSIAPGEDALFELRVWRAGG
jgi:uncharacterized protein (DUF2249 family)